MWWWQGDGSGASELPEIHFYHECYTRGWTQGTHNMSSGSFRQVWIGYYDLYLHIPHTGSQNKMMAISNSNKHEEKLEGLTHTNEGCITKIRFLSLGNLAAGVITIIDMNIWPLWHLIRNGGPNNCSAGTLRCCKVLNDVLTKGSVRDKGLKVRYCCCDKSGFDHKRFVKGLKEYLETDWKKLKACLMKCYPPEEEEFSVTKKALVKFIQWNRNIHNLTSFNEYYRNFRLLVNALEAKKKLKEDKRNSLFIHGIPYSLPQCGGNGISIWYTFWIVLSDD